MGSIFERGWFGRAEAALTGLALGTAAFWLLGDDQEASVLFGLAFLAMIAGRAVGIPRQALLLLALTIATLGAVVLVDGPAPPFLTSSLAHFVASAMLAWALSRPVASRVPVGEGAGAPRAVLTLAAVVFALGVCWEIAEHVADGALETALAPSAGDTLLDLTMDLLGAVVGALVAVRLGAREGASVSAHPRAQHVPRETQGSRTRSLAAQSTPGRTSYR